MKKYLIFILMLNFISFAYAHTKNKRSNNEINLYKAGKKYAKTGTTAQKQKAEKVYKQLFLEDSMQLSALIKEGTSNAWYLYKAKLNEMQKRQLAAQKWGINCDNYDYDNSLYTAKQYFAEKNTHNGQVNLKNAVLTQNRNLAQKAYNELVFAYQLSGDESLLPSIDKARKVSKTHLLITINNYSDVAIPQEIKQQILADFKTGEYKNMVVSTQVEPGIQYDFIVSVTIDDISIDNYWSGYWGANVNYDVYESGFAKYTAPHNFTLSCVMNRGIIAKALTNNITFQNWSKYLSPYEQSLISYNRQFKGHVPLFRMFNINGKYELINVRAKQVIAQEPLKFYRKISPSTLIPLTPGEIKDREEMKFAIGFYQTNLAETFLTNPLFNKHIHLTVRNELGRFLVDNEHVFLGKLVYACK